MESEWGVGQGMGARFTSPLPDARRHGHFVNTTLAPVPCEPINVTMRRQQRRKSAPSCYLI